MLRILKNISKYSLVIIWHRVAVTSHWWQEGSSRSLDFENQSIDLSPWLVRDFARFFFSERYHGQKNMTCSKCWGKHISAISADTSCHHALTRVVSVGSSPHTLITNFTPQSRESAYESSDTSAGKSYVTFPVTPTFSPFNILYLFRIASCTSFVLTGLGVCLAGDCPKGPASS